MDKLDLSNSGANEIAAKKEARRVAIQSYLMMSVEELATRLIDEEAVKNKAINFIKEKGLAHEFTVSK